MTAPAQPSVGLPIWIVYITAFLTPLMFSSNAIFGIVAVQSIEPFTLAFLRWFLASCLLLALSWQQLPLVLRLWRQRPLYFLVQGILGMWIAGGLIYWALKHTTATNGLLIYTLTPALVILIEYFTQGRQSRTREWAGILVAMFGVLVIVCQGSVQTLLELRFNPGDLCVLVAAIGWAFFTLGLRDPQVSGLGTFAQMGSIGMVGAGILLPFAGWELVQGAPLPSSGGQWTLIGGIVLISSLLAFSSFQLSVNRLGASLSAIFMYLLAPFGVALAFIFLGERLLWYHWIGAGLVMLGVIAATFPAKRL